MKHRLYSDENFPLPVVLELRRLGHDVLTLSEDGHAEQSLSDEHVLALAVEHHRAILTMDRRHFIRLHQTHPDHAGIVACTYDPNFIGQARRISDALDARTTLAGQVIRIYR